MNSELPAAVGHLRFPHKAKVLLKLKPNDYHTARLKYQLKDNQRIVLKIDEDDNTNSSIKINRDMSVFTFDEIFDVSADEKKVAEAITGSTIKDLLNGYNVSIMTYGQTKTGKSTVLLGNKNSEGIIKKICKILFDKIGEKTQLGSQFTISASFTEVVAEKVHDLLTAPNSIKTLKLSTHSKPFTPAFVKNLTTVHVATLDELLYYMTLARNNLDGRRDISRSNVLIKVQLEERNENESTIKKSLLHFVDLAGSEKLDKDLGSDLSLEDIKKINLSMYSLDNVARSLAAGDSTIKGENPLIQGQKNVPYRDSHLTRLLQDTIGGNSKTTVLLTCSTALKDREETLNTLDFGANMVTVKNLVEQNKSGINAKCILDLSIANMSLKESNYLSRITLLEEELAKMKGRIRNELEPEITRKEMLGLENNTLKLQMDSLAQLIKNDDFGGSTTPDKKQARHDMMGTIMEKCEKIMTLQLKLDNETATRRAFSRELSYKASKQEALEAMNLRLLEQLQRQEEDLKTMLVSNSLMKDSIEKWSNLANTRLDNIKALEKSLKEISFSKQDVHNKRRSSGSSSGSTMVQIEEDSHVEKGSWFFNNSSSTLWGNKKASSSSSALTAGSQDSFRIRAPKIGFNLRVVRPTEEESNKV